MVALVVDGISASGKSMLLKTLQSIVGEDCPNFSKLYMTEHLTERFFEKALPAVADVHGHVARILRIVHDLQELQRSGPFSANAKVLTITIERLFLTLMSRDLMTIDFFRDHAELVSALDLTSVLLVVPGELIENRIAQSMRHRNQGWSDYVGRLGGLRGAVAHFERQQDAMLRANDALAAYMRTERLAIPDLEQLTTRHMVERVLWPDI